MPKKEIIEAQVTQIEDGGDGTAFIDFSLPPKIAKYVKKYRKRHGNEATLYLMDDGSMQIRIGKVTVVFERADPPAAETV
jgi:hypothetical protein